MSIEKFAGAAQHALDAAAAFAHGDHVNGVRHLVEGGLDVYTAEAFKQVVDDATVRRANALADRIEDERFGPEKA